MSSPVLFDTQGGGFDAPFEMLDACHDRVRRLLGLLGRLHEHLQAYGADTQAMQAAKDVMRYFDLSAPAHHEDEERHVFPVLLEADAARWSPLIERLQSDHRRMALTWIDARAVLDRVSLGQWDDVAVADSEAWTRFRSLYTDHLIAEDQEAFPAAAELIDAQAQATMGSEMASRRGVTQATAI